MQSYHQAVARRLQAITDNQLEITDIYSLLDWLHNIYNRYTDRDGAIQSDGSRVLYSVAILIDLSEAFHDVNH